MTSHRYRTVLTEVHIRDGLELQQNGVQGGGTRTQLGVNVVLGGRIVWQRGWGDVDHPETARIERRQHWSRTVTLYHPGQRMIDQVVKVTCREVSVESSQDGGYVIPQLGLLQNPNRVVRIGKNVQRSANREGVAR